MRSHRRFIALLVLFAAGVLAQGLALPVMEGSDEPLHSTYTALMRRGFQLPERDNVRESATRQESGQPPLTYWLAAQVANALQLPSRDPDDLLDYLYTVRNDWLTPPDAWNRRDNLNHYFHGPGEVAFGAPDIVMTNRVLRLTSLVYGLLAVAGAYGAARELFRRHSWALAATAIFAFMPTMIHISAYLTNDISAVAFATLATWQALRLLRLGATPGRCLVIGGLLALGALSKVSALLVAPGVGLALLLDWRNRRDSLIRLLGHGLLIALPVLVLFGPWVAWGWIHYRDPFGFLTHHNPTLSYTELLSPGRVLSLMPEVYLSYWAKFGLAKIYLHPLTYTLLGAIAAVAVLGYAAGLVGRRSRGFAPERRLRIQQALVLAVVALAVLAGLIRWMQEIAIITGRLLYPAHVAIALGLAGGLQVLGRRWPRLAFPLRVYAVGLVAAAGLIYGPVAIYQAYRPPMLLTADQLPPLQGGPVDYDQTIRLLGMAQESPVLRGDRHTLTLCWEVLRPAARPAAFSVKFVRDGLIVADRTSVHGLGQYPAAAWEPGAIFCDDVDILFDDPDVDGDPLPQPATVYDVLVVLLDAETREVDWQPTLPDGREIQFPFVGQVVRPAGDMASSIEADLISTEIDFPGCALLEGYALEGTPQPGASLTLDLLWRVTGATPDDWTQFIHLTGPDTSLSLADGPPRAGAYPTWAWTPGERVADRWLLALPDDLQPGTYALTLGFYRRDTGERMPAEANGAALADNAAELLRFDVE